MGKIAKLPQSMANDKEIVGILDQLLADAQTEIDH